MAKIRRDSWQLRQVSKSHECFSKKLTLMVVKTLYVDKLWITPPELDKPDKQYKKIVSKIGG